MSEVAKEIVQVLESEFVNEHRQQVALAALLHGVKFAVLARNAGDEHFEQIDERPSYDEAKGVALAHAEKHWADVSVKAVVDAFSLTQTTLSPIQK